MLSLDKTAESINDTLMDVGLDNTVNAEIFARILFSRIVLKDIFAELKNRD